LKNGGFIELKTDNYALFEYSMMIFNHDENFDIIDISLDLYKHLPETNIQTEFEMKFVEEDKAIYYLKLKHIKE
jgi:tRNA G46 methylase TrmB